MFIQQAKRQFMTEAKKILTILPPKSSIPKVLHFCHFHSEIVDLNLLSHVQFSVSFTITGNLEDVSI